MCSVENKKRVAFITGGGGYLGSGIAYALAKSGVAVAVCDINADTVEKTVETIKKMGGVAVGHVADVSDSKNITETIEQAAKELGRLDILVHAAGGAARIAGKDTKNADLVDQEDWIIEHVLRVNLYGAIWSNRAAARIMIRQGEGGKIINFSSTVGINGMRGCVDYAASKGGIMAMTKVLAKELGPHKINVNAVAPGIVCRPEVDTTTPGGHHYAYETNLLGEKCTAEDVANLVEFLASEKSNFITGQTYVIDGGRMLSLKGSD